MIKASKISVRIDYVPFICVLIDPSFNVVNSAILKTKESKSIQDIVDIMKDFGLIYVQNKSTLDSEYQYKLDPPIYMLLIENAIFKIAMGLKDEKKYYNTKQMISQKLEKIKIIKEVRHKMKKIDIQLEQRKIDIR